MKPKTGSFAGQDKQYGFTLLELLVVLFIIVLGFSAISLNLSSGNDTTKIKAAARDIASALRFARGHALMFHQQATLTINLDDNSYTVTGREKHYQLPETIAITVVTAQDELSGKQLANIRFFADGSSTGGRITLEHGSSVKRVNINWLTGQIEIDEDE